MAVHIPSLAREWLDQLEGLDWLNFRGHRLHSLKYVRDVIIRPELLHAAVRFWDPEVHVFRFGLQEVCPTVEEFHTYIGGFGLESPVIPLPGANFARMLVDQLKMSKNAARAMIEGNTINLPRFMEKFPPTTNFALCVVLLAVFLLTSPDGRVSPSLIGVATQIEDQKDVAPMVLAETLIGLDAVHSGRTRDFGGSALFLQVGFSLSSPFSGFSHFLILPQLSAGLF